MKIQVVQKCLRSRRHQLSQPNILQLSLLSTFLLNLVMVLCSTTVKAAEPDFKNSTPEAPAESTLAVPLNSPTSLADDALPVVTEVPGAIVNLNPPSQPLLTQPLLSIEADPSSIPVIEDTSTTQPISKTASDLSGANAPQTSAQAPLAQTETTIPADSSSEVKPVNNPLMPPPGWRFDFEPYLFLPLDVKGDIFFGKGRRLLFPNRPGVILGDAGINLDVDARLSDITARITNIFGISGRFQAWNGNFGIVAEGLYVNSGFRGSSDGRTFTLRDRFDISIPGFQIDTRNTLSSFSLGASYRFLTLPLRTITDPANPSNYYPAISLEALAGFRYLSVFQSVELARGPDFEFSGSEVNPMLGGTARLMLSDQFALFFRGDISNLGGGNLKQYYNLYAGVDWKFSSSFALRLAYRFNRIEFVKQGRFDGENGLDLRTQGVQLGLSWQF
ncbi:outer membrane protein [Pantanalinema rosaneae CENA516]|uniref:outer membrane protein n=1 Tax=Pantanalinema rosaneae TaxID=1620701 RepID=UPI003D6DBA4B